MPSFHEGGPAFLFKASTTEMILMARQDPDEALVALFKNLAVPNDGKTLQAGRPIFDDIEVCEIRSPGSRDVKVFPATAFSHWQNNPYTGEQTKVTYAERFAHQYRQFKAHDTQTKSGTPLDYAPFMSVGKCAEMRAQNIYTVEALAAIDGQELKNLGAGGRELKNAAAAYMAETKSAAPNLQLQNELEQLRARNAILEEDLSAKKAREAQINGEFEAMDLDQLREFIATNTGHPPHGSLNRKTLVRMAIECRPDKAA
jgi:hypothetical protein